MVYIREHFSNHVPVENGYICISFHNNMLYQGYNILLFRCQEVFCLELHKLLRGKLHCIGFAANPCKVKLKMLLGMRLRSLARVASVCYYVSRVFKVYLFDAFHHRSA